MKHDLELTALVAEKEQLLRQEKHLLETEKQGLEQEVYSDPFFN
jgi:hypothetical protein